MKVITVNNLADAYRQTIEHIVWPQNHQERITEDEEVVWKSKHMITLEVSQPNTDLERLIAWYPLGIHGMQVYADEVMTGEYPTKGTAQEFDYCYYDRLFEYTQLRNLEVNDRCITRNVKIDQIQCIIDKINNHQGTRRACATTWYPFEDNSGKTTTPCLQWVKFEVNDGRLDMTTLWRSRDCLMALGGNLYAMNALHNFVAENVNKPIGWYYDIIDNGHIYHKRDMSELKLKRLDRNGKSFSYL
jgi:thymidylate synthase (methanogen type)